MVFSKNIVVGLLLLTLLSGCDPFEKRGVQQDAVLKKSEAFNQGYLEGDINYARRCLYDNAALLEQATILEPIGRAQLLSFTYARLYVLEKRAGKNVEADANLVKTRFWALKAAELEGRKLDEKRQEIDKLTPDQLIAFVDESDKNLNRGNSPAYLEAEQRQK
jgi:hypothetical protein